MLPAVVVALLRNSITESQHGYARRPEFFWIVVKVTGLASLGVGFANGKRTPLISFHCSFADVLQRLRPQANGRPKLPNFYPALGLWGLQLLGIAGDYGGEAPQGVGLLRLESLQTLRSAVLRPEAEGWVQWLLGRQTQPSSDA